MIGISTEDTPQRVVGQQDALASGPLTIRGFSKSFEDISAHPAYSCCNSDVAGFQISTAVGPEGCGNLALVPLALIVSG